MDIISCLYRGTDTLAEHYAKEHEVQCVVFIPDWEKHGKKAGIMRNADIVEQSQYCIAFPSRYGKGTQDSIKRATDKKIPTKVFWID